jgi:hypothetical protein
VNDLVQRGDLSIRRQCALLGLAHSGVYRKPRPANDNDLEAMRRIDALFTARPLFGARRIVRTLSEEGFPINRNRAVSNDGVEHCRTPIGSKAVPIHRSSAPKRRPQMRAARHKADASECALSRSSRIRNRPAGC